MEEVIDNYFTVVFIIAAIGDAIKKSVCLIAISFITPSISISILCTLI